MQFKVRALSSAQLMMTLTIEASSEEHARQQLHAQGLYATAITPLKTVSSKRSKHNFSLLLFSEELLSLVRAGLSIVESLEALLEKERDDSALEVLTQLLNSLRSGHRFSAALSQQPNRFSSLYVGLVSAAEGSSDLPLALTRFINYQQRIDMIRNKLVSAAIYPVILLSVGAVVSLFLMIYVVPRFAEVYRSAGRPLPALSQALLDWGAFASRHQTGLIILLILAGGSLCLPAVRNRLRSWLLQLPSNIPGVGEQVLLAQLTRLWLTLAMLLDGGLPLLTALKNLQHMATLDLKHKLQAAQLEIESGCKLSEAFDRHGLSTSVALSLLRVGERTGTLSQMLQEAASFHESVLNRWIDRFTRTAEPLLMMAIGLVIGAIVVLLYMPVFDLAGSLN